MQVRRGTSIIEIVIATALISVAIIAAVSLTNQSQKQNSYARGLAEATKYGSQAADWIRTERNNLGWATMYASNPDAYCLNTFPADFTLIESGACQDGDFIAGTRYQREITLSQAPEALHVTITVSWEEAIERSATIELELTSWH